MLVIQPRRMVELVRLDSSIVHRLMFYSWQVVVRSVILLLSNSAERGTPSWLLPAHIHRLGGVALEV